MSLLSSGKECVQLVLFYLFIYLFIYFAVLGLELRAFTLSHSPSHFSEDVFEIGSHELFAQAGL
jgi:hypothetical protein